MADCGKYRQMMSIYIDKELSAKENALFQRHLNGCASCRARLAAYETISKAAAEALEEPPAELSDQIMKNVRFFTVQTSKTGKKKPILKPVLISTAAAAACLALVFFGVPQLFNLGGSSKTASSVPERAYASAPASEAGDGLNVSIKSADTGETEGAEAYDTASSEAMMGLKDDSEATQDSDRQSAEGYGTQAMSGDTDNKAYYATFIIKGQLPELLKDSAMKDNRDGTYSIEISVQTAQRLIKDGYTAVMGGKNMEKALVIYSAE